MTRVARHLTSVAWAAGQLLSVAAVLVIWLHGWDRDFRVPVHFSADSLEYLMQAKGTISNGWWWIHPRLSAPSTFPELAYPSNTNVDQAIVWLMHFFTADPGLGLNAAWILMVALSGVISTWGFRQAGLSRLAAMPIGVLFALSPYALYRNIEHFSLATYLVPVPCVAALLVCSGRLPSFRAPVTRLAAAGCVLIALNYAYYAFFSAFVLLTASIVAALGHWRDATWRRGLVLVAVISVVTAVNLSPSFVVWAERGQPLIVPDKTVAESEIYGMKIRQLVSPVLDQSFAPFKAWTDAERRAKYPTETENTTSRLGLVGTIGFLGLLVVLIPPALRRRGRTPRSTHTSAEGQTLLQAAAVLTLALVLLGTTGGFGSLFSLLVSPEIRSYNRVYPFIAFFALFAVGWSLDWILTRATRRRWALALVAAVLVTGLYDESHAAVPLNRIYPAIRDERASLAPFVKTLEDKLPAGSMVFQLPLTTYLNDAGDVRMLPYDEIKPYLYSASLHWSYPAIDNAVVRWQHAVARLPVPAFAAAIGAAGFAAVVIDRNGYEDNGASAVADLRAVAGPGGIIAETGRYVALDVRDGHPVADPAVALPVWRDQFEPASAGLAPCDAAARGNLDSVNGVKVPSSGTVSIASGSASADVVFRGWAVGDVAQALAGDVDLVVDGVAWATFYGVDRPDIATRFGAKNLRYSGFVTKLPVARLGPGTHAVSVRVVGTNRRCAWETPPVMVVR